MAETVVFSPIDYDAENIPPDAPPGAWRAVATAKVSKTSKDSYPMVIVEWELETAYEEENESFVGARVADFITFFPETRAQASRMSKVRLRTFCDKLGISRSLIPKHIASSDDLADFIAAIDGQTTDIWTAVDRQTNKESGEVIERVKVFYKAPGGVGAAGALPPVDAEDEEDEPESDDPELEEDEEPEVAAKPPLRAVSAPPKTGVKAKTVAAPAKKAGGRR